MKKLFTLFIAGLIGLWGCATTGGPARSDLPQPPTNITSQYATPPYHASGPYPHEKTAEGYGDGTGAYGAYPSEITLSKPQPSGSLWNSSSRNSPSLYRDIKARHIGDVVTITVSESADASEEASTETSRTHNWGGKISGSDAIAGGKKLIGGDSSFDYGVEFGRELKGTGKTTRTNSVKAYMTATVIDVLPNGNLVIRGSRWVKVNDELHQVVLEGVVRPVDISRNNTVLSQQIADAKIFVMGKGPVARQQKPGWLSQIIDLLFPF